MAEPTIRVEYDKATNTWHLNGQPTTPDKLAAVLNNAAPGSVIFQTAGKQWGGKEGLEAAKVNVGRAVEAGGPPPTSGTESFQLPESFRLLGVLQGAGLPLKDIEAFMGDVAVQKDIEAKAPGVLAQLQANDLLSVLEPIKQQIAGAEGDLTKVEDLDAVKMWLAASRARGAEAETEKCSLCGGDHATEECPLATTLGGDGGMSAEEKQYAAAGMALQILSELGARERASVQELGDIAERWTGLLKRAVTPELKEMIASRTFTKPEEMQTQRVSLAGIKERAEKLPDIEAQMPQMQRVLAQLLPGLRSGGYTGQINLSPEQAQSLMYGSAADTSAYGLGPYEADTLIGQDWYIDEQGYAQQLRPQWQSGVMGDVGRIFPELLGLPSEQFGPALQQALGGEGGYPTMEAQGQDLTREVEVIRAQADTDVAEINKAAEIEAQRIRNEGQAKAAAETRAGMEAQAQATIEAAEAAAQATIEAAQIAAENRLAIAEMQEQGARERLGAQLGMQWAETSQQMAANPRDFLQLAFRQAGMGIPPALQNFLQPAGGAVPTTKGAPSGLQSILAEYLGM